MKSTFFVALFTALVCVAAADKVKVRVYMEAQCPVCISYMTSTMTDVFNCDGIDAIADIQVIPYGNARLDSNRNIHCQHGADECTSNLLMSCAIGLHSFKFAAYFPFIHCLETSNGDPNAAQNCAAQAKLSWSKISSCAASGQGKQFQLQMARATMAADNDYTPWVVVNGAVVRSEAKANNLLGLICSLSTSSSKPACCSSSEQEMMTSVTVHSDEAPKVCWRSNERKAYYLRDHDEIESRQQLHEPVGQQQQEEEEENIEENDNNNDDDDDDEEEEENTVDVSEDEDLNDVLNYLEEEIDEGNLRAQ